MSDIIKTVEKTVEGLQKIGLAPYLHFLRPIDGIVFSCADEKMMAEYVREYFRKERGDTNLALICNDKTLSSDSVIMWISNYILKHGEEK